MKVKLLDLFEYTHHCNREMIKFISENALQNDEKIVRLLNHILNAQQVWNSRILGEKSFDVWQINAFEDLENINRQNFLKSIEIIANRDLDRKIRYQNSKGSKFENSIFEVLFQIVNHSTYHRGQINSLIKNAGFEAVLTDYIFYKR
ncbi:MAG: damage-inducible protein DinB [Flavobacteriaceae bacterium]|jgi:uncharacterized damage-inducible protein DinB|nr:damage-inducible protein DinB [Flavobacteriaceae bacterium]